VLHRQGTAIDGRPCQPPRVVRTGQRRVAVCRAPPAPCWFSWPAGPCAARSISTA